MGGLTNSELFAAALAIASAIVVLSNAAEKIIKAVKAAKAPNKQQDVRLDKLEAWKLTVDAKLDSDFKRLCSLDSGGRVTQRAILALLAHSLDGNNVKQMEEAKESLEQYLINR